jgi:hypothetical protein
MSTLVYCGSASLLVTNKYTLTQSFNLFSQSSLFRKCYMFRPKLSLTVFFLISTYITQRHVFHLYDIRYEGDTCKSGYTLVTLPRTVTP